MPPPPSQPLVASCSRRWMATGARGAPGAPARGRVVAACSSPTATATTPGPSTAAGTARGSAPATSRVTPTSARRTVSHLAAHPLPSPFLCSPSEAVLGKSCLLQLCSHHPRVSPASPRWQRRMVVPASQPGALGSRFCLPFQARAFGSSSARSTTATTSPTWMGTGWSGSPSTPGCPPGTAASSFAEPGGGANLKSLRPK